MGKSVVITGTSTGIGRACTEKMAADGWTVYAGVRREADADTLHRELTGDVRPVILDVTDADQISDLVGRLQNELGSAGLDGLVNNAGVAEGGPIESLTADDWRRHFEVNLFGPVALTRECFGLLHAGRGRVVNIGSLSGRAAAPMLGPYSAAKHAIAAYSESLRFEVEQFGMKVSCVEPGQVASAIWSKADEQLQRIDSTLEDDIKARYRKHLDMLHGFVHTGARKGVPASRVADAVHHALTAPRPKDRYLVGPDARMGGVATRMPDPVRRRLLEVSVNQWVRQGRKVRAG